MCRKNFFLNSLRMGNLKGQHWSVYLGNEVTFTKLETLQKWYLQ